MGKMFEELKENMIWMSKQIENVNREKKIIKKNQGEILNWKAKKEISLKVHWKQQKSQWTWRKINRN